MKENIKIFFCGLNELRALAALAVIFHHIELFKARDGFPSLLGFKHFCYFISYLGKNGVYLFFVLSGFLITFLLLEEKEKNHTVMLKKFFLRRIFRIWPLYYFILIISFLLIPFLAHSFDIFKLTPYYFGRICNMENYNLNSILMYLFFLPNRALHFGKLVVGCSQSWSVGVEEQFYILWPFLLLLFNRKLIFWVFIFITLFYFFVDAIPIQKLSVLTRLFPFHFMSIGALGGYLYRYYSLKIEEFSKSKMIYWFLILVISLFWVTPITEPFSQSFILGFLFLGLILVTINNDNPAVIRNKTFSYLGSISYGIYMYHPFVMFLVFPLANKYFANSIFIYNCFVYVFIFFITILISHISYKYFESFFIRIKDVKYKSI